MEQIVNDEFVIRPFQEKDLPLFKQLIKTSWNENHVLLKSEELMMWQYRGFGSKEGMHFPSLFDSQGNMIGFRGVFPVEINIPQSDVVKTMTMAVGSLYLVIPEHRGKKLGLALQQFTQQYYGNYMAIGSNLGTSAPIYKKSGYLMLDQMNRYLVPFDSNYEKLLVEENKDFEKYIWNGDCEGAMPVNMSSTELSSIWNSSPCSKMLSINKTESFWEWRYLNHPVYKYYFFGGKEKGGLIVGRICGFYDNQGKLLDWKLFRILEIIPSEDFSSLSNDSSKLCILLKQVLKWAKSQGCFGTETYMTSKRFNDLLTNCGMALLSDENQELNIISNYEPITKSPKLTNVSIYLGEENTVNDFDGIYMSLADSDQDRPNIIEK